MLIKAGVDISRLKRPLRRTLGPVAVICWEIEEQELVVTSTFEGNHSEGSLHYCDLAYDIRTWKNPRKVRDAIKLKIGFAYDVIVEEDHIHIEYDPK